jgi:hypothetical protein
MRGKLRAEVHTWTVLYFMNDFLGRAIEGHDFVRQSDASDNIKTIVLGGALQYLALLDEGLVALEELAPPLAEIRKHFDADLSQWRSFRDDAAHIADRLIRESQGARNEAGYKTSQQLQALGVLNYDYVTDIVRTGGEGVQGMKVGQAIERAKELCEFTLQRISQQERPGSAAPVWASVEVRVKEN